MRSERPLEFLTFTTSASIIYFPNMHDLVPTWGGEEARHNMSSIALHTSLWGYKCLAGRDSSELSLDNHSQEKQMKMCHVQS